MGAQAHGSAVSRHASARVVIAHAFEFSPADRMPATSMPAMRLPDSAFLAWPSWCSPKATSSTSLTLAPCTDVGATRPAELFGTVARADRQGRAIRNDRYKLIEFSSGGVELYDLLADRRGETPIGSRNAAEQAAFDELSAQPDARVATAP